MRPVLAAVAVAPLGCSSSGAEAADGGMGASVDAIRGDADATRADAQAALDGGAASAPIPVTVPTVVRPSCPAGGMALIGEFCIDKWEAYVVELDAQGEEHPHSPYETVDGLTVRAKSAPGVVPQGYISQVQASQACARAGKRLCSAEEFHLACGGPNADDWYPYGGTTHQPGYCNEGKGSMLPVYYGTNSATWTYADFNDPRLNQVDGGLARTGSYARCESLLGLYDCVGNLHEWGADPADANGHGRFRGGFYGDAEVNGHGCLYVTSAHEPSYHDYSTGFRCCADAAWPTAK
jgi:hypothetical protein